MPEEPTNNSGTRRRRLIVQTLVAACWATVLSIGIQGCIILAASRLKLCSEPRIVEFQKDFHTSYCAMIDSIGCTTILYDGSDYYGTLLRSGNLEVPIGRLPRKHEYWMYGPDRVCQDLNINTKSGMDIAYEQCLGWPFRCLHAWGSSFGNLRASPGRTVSFAATPQRVVVPERFRPSSLGDVQSIGTNRSIPNGIVGTRFSILLAICNLAVIAVIIMIFYVTSYIFLVAFRYRSGK